MIRDIGPEDLPALLALNNSEAAAVNELSAEDFAAQVAVAFAARMMADGSGFLVAFDQTTPRQGPNHGWFIHRGGSFAYVDRVAVAPEARGRGVGRALYEDLAAISGQKLACEVNIDPPNPAGLGFHESLGFLPVGEAVDPRTGKRVRYLVK